MKFISKLLYSLVSFTIFTAYKVENAFATVKVKLIGTPIDVTSTECNRYDDALTARSKYSNTDKEIDMTICSAGTYLVSCAGAMASTASAALLASLCSPSTATCSSCPTPGTVGASYKYKITETTFTMCSNHGYDEDFNIINKFSLPTVQQYSLYLADEDKISANILTNCHLPSGTSVTDGTGTYTSTIACDYE